MHASGLESGTFSVFPLGHRGRQRMLGDLLYVGISGEGA
jgi:hypothetical protein